MSRPDLTNTIIEVIDSLDLAQETALDSQTKLTTIEVDSLDVSEVIATLEVRLGVIFPSSTLESALGCDTLGELSDVLAKAKDSAVSF